MIFNKHNHSIQRCLSFYVKEEEEEEVGGYVREIHTVLGLKFNSSTP